MRNPSKFFCVLTLSLGLLPCLARADDAHAEYVKCTSHPEIPVLVTPRFDPPAYDYTQSIAAISALATDTHHSIHEKLTLGLTRYEPIISISAPMVGIKSSNGTNCSYVKQVDVTVGYRNVIVYIAREIPEGTCGFNQVMAHEQKHVAVNAGILQKYVPRIESDLSWYLQNNGVLYGDDPSEALQAMHDKLTDIIKESLTKMTAENQVLQQEIDNPEEYARVSASCNGQLRVAAAQSLRQH